MPLEINNKLSLKKFDDIQIKLRPIQSKIISPLSTGKFQSTQVALTEKPPC